MAEPARDLARADQILLEGIEVPASLGVTAAERRMRRPVRLDLEIGFDLADAGRSDQLAKTLDYQAIYDVAADVAGKSQHKLVEALGQRIVDALLARFPIEWVTITVRKPKPIAGVLTFAGIRITRRR